MSGDVATRLLDAGYPIASGTVTVSGETIALGVTADRAPFGARERAAVAEWLHGLADDMTRTDDRPKRFGWRDENGREHEAD